jgi:ubiquinol-cytochrome c reductase cytochrome c subunit
MGLRLLRRILIPFAALVAAASLATLLMGRAHAASPSGQANPMSLTAASSASKKAEIQTGYELFENHCSFCHGARANGSTGIAPNLQGLGPGTIQLWLATGWMPLKTPSAQPDNKPPSFNPQHIKDIALWVASLHKGGVSFPPKLHINSANLADGFSLFTDNCAPCHTITGAGDALADGYHAPPLHGVTAQEIYDAVRSGPQNMPQFSTSNITPAQLRDIIKYVTREIKHPTSPGGLALGGVGPVAEGFVGLFIGVGGCLLAAYWVGDRTERENEEDPGAEGPGSEREVTHA